MIEKSAKYRRIGEKLMTEIPDLIELKETGVRIAYLTSDKEKIQNRKIVFADCRKVAPQYEWCCPYDFMITVYEPNVIDFNREQLKILIEHELMHCGVDTEADEPSFYIVPHDIEEFYTIIEKYGMGWQTKK